MNILITGANRGLGYYLTKQGLARGHHVIAGVRSLTENTSSLAELQQLQQENPKQLTLVALEVTQEEMVKKAAEEIAETFGALDVIVNNAAVLVARDKQIEEIDVADIQFSFDVNVYGPIRVIKHFLPLLRKGENQSILNISSEAGSMTNAYGGDYPYALTKTTLNMLSQQLHRHLGKEQIMVYAIHPSWMRTDMGGANAPTDPLDSAIGIMDLLEKKVQVEATPFAFIDHLGKPMPI